ncbi:hypothetical protein LCN96_13215 [Nonomuraea gerenzanensis]|nr:hypothetical protein LCN96_13215 [Nonomuraea gerenzanensis]
MGEDPPPPVSSASGPLSSASGPVSWPVVPGAVAGLLGATPWPAPVFWIGCEGLAVTSHQVTTKARMATARLISTGARRHAGVRRRSRSGSGPEGYGAV